MYIKDSIIEAQIEKDLKKQHVKGRIEEVERELGFRAKGKRRCSGLEERLEKLRGELNLLSD
ncbi:MAG: hypothetical protein WAW23_00095 [Candidatus Methanoperedens sp.]